MAITNSHDIYIYALKHDKIFKTIHLENEKITLIAFDLSSKYLIVGTTQGRVLQYRYNSKHQLARLCSFPYYMPGEQKFKITNNYVSAISFYKTLMACSGYGGAVYIINMYSREDTIVINRSKAKIEALCFVDESTLLCGNNDGVLEVISLQETHITRKLNMPFLKIKNIVLMPNQAYALVSSDKNFVTLVDIRNLKIVEKQYLTFENKIEKILRKDDESILVVLKDASILHTELTNINTLKTLIEKERLIQAFKLLVAAPMLKYSAEHTRLKNKYQHKLEQAIFYLIKNDVSSAKEITNPFLVLKYKQDEIYLIYEAFKHYLKFQTIFHEQRFNLAYSIATKYPALQYTIEYKSMEKVWQQKFLEAQKKVLLHDLESARILLSEYMSVASKRPLIKLILYKNKEFLHFIKAVEKKEFHKIPKLIKENKIFAETQHYQMLNNELEESVVQVNELIQVGNISLAEVLIEKISDSPKHQDLVDNLYVACDDMKEFYDLYNQNNLFDCYALIDVNPTVQTSDLAILLEQQWTQLILKSEKYALQGKIEAVKDTFGSLLKLPSRCNKIGDILRLSYSRSADIFMDQAAFEKVQQLIIQYTNLFGLDTEIDLIISCYVKKSKKKIHLSEEQAKRKPRDYWLFSI